VIDDFGVEYADQRGVLASIVDELIDRRYGDRRATIICTNLTATEFRKRYGDRVADRLREAGRFRVISESSLRSGGKVPPHVPDPVPEESDLEAAMSGPARPDPEYTEKVDAMIHDLTSRLRKNGE